MSAAHAITGEVARSVYAPTRTQFRFLESRAPFAAFFGGYGGGKTFAGAQKALRLALANQGLTGLVISPTWGMLSRTTLPTFRGVLPAGLEVEHHKQERRIVLANGSTIYFGSADRPGSLEGTNVAWAWIDEARLVTREAFDVLVGRVRDRRASLLQTVLTTTPAMGWLSEFFDGTKPDRVAFHGSTRENAHNLAPGFVERLLATYSARKAQALVEGQFTVLTGAVYEEFAEERHRVRWTFDPDLRTGLMIDFGVACPSVLAFQITSTATYTADGRLLPAGSCVIFDELHPDNTPTERLVKLIAAQPWASRVDVIYCDPAGNARDQASGMPSVHYVREAFPRADVRWTTDPAGRWIPNGIALVQGALAPADGSPPRLYVAGELFDSNERRGLVKSLRGYSYPERADGGQKGDVPVKDGVYDHANDALRYGVVGLERDAAAFEATRGRPVRIVHGGHG